MAFVYGFRAKDSNKYFYVGSTKYSIEHRFKQHLDSIRRGRNKNRHFVNKINKVKPENIVIDVIEECTTSVRFEREYAHIQHLLTDGHPLTNIVYTHEYAKYRTWDECEEEGLSLDRIIQIIDIHERGWRRNGNELHDLLADTAEKIVDTIMGSHFEEFTRNVKDIMSSMRDDKNPDGETNGVYQRLSHFLERHQSRA